MCPREISFALSGSVRYFARSARPISHWDGGIGASVLSGKTMYPSSGGCAGGCSSTPLARRGGEPVLAPGPPLGEPRLHVRALGHDLRTARIAEPGVIPVFAPAIRTLCHVYHPFTGFLLPMIVVAWRKSFFADSLSESPVRATVACAVRIVVMTSPRAGFARTAAAGPAAAPGRL